LARFCEIFAKSADGNKAICIDLENKAEILAYITQSARHKKKWLHIVQLLLEGKKNTELYDKENINSKAGNITAMKFFKGQENDRLYCKEQRTPQGIYIIVGAILLLGKKSNKVTKKEIPIINKIANYEYEIKENSNQP
jgi:hypothetical protein